ncbi:hypothetical protein LV779_02895 [Streptomyces thinghirensis]|nr:hypothetical protein [Streptomyces thinghirensis]
MPEEIREYWVEVDGVHWPVKQVISLATGAKRSRFQSQPSRRWLQNLGFLIGAGSLATESGSNPAVDRRDSSWAFEESQLEDWRRSTSALRSRG